jgi:hypothetical protein
MDLLGTICLEISNNKVGDMKISTCFHFTDSDRCLFRNVLTTFDNYDNFMRYLDDRKDMLCRGIQKNFPNIILSLSFESKTDVDTDEIIIFGRPKKIQIPKTLRITWSRY